jgi:hypothetical protein
MSDERAPFRDAIAAAEARVAQLEEDVRALRERLAVAQREGGEELRTTRALAARLRDEVTALERELGTG